MDLNLSNKVLDSNTLSLFPLGRGSASKRALTGTCLTHQVLTQQGNNQMTLATE